MIKVFLKLSLLCVLLISCGNTGNSVGLLSSRVVVVPAPYGIGDNVRPSRPTIFISKGRYPCRPRPVNQKTMINYLENAKLSSTGFANIFGISQDEVDLIANSTVSQTRLGNLRPVRVDVGGDGNGWLKLGLFIGNGNIGTSRNFFLVVDSVSFVATAQYRNKNYQVSNDIQAGYCSGGESSSTSGGNSQERDGVAQDQNVDLTSPFLYIVPPGTKIEYSPTSDNPFHNLTLYLSGFEIIDRTEKLAPDQKNRLDGVGDKGESGSSESDDTFFSGDSLIVIPRYTVDLTLRGYFITAEGDLVAAFTKRVRFFTQSSTEF